MNKQYFLFLTIILLFLITRLYKISEIPPSLYWDEASIGYNAYSILKTGKDEWGNFLPIHFRAFGEFKLPVYIYVTVLSEFFLGLSELAVRIPSVLFSLTTVFLLYLLTLKIFQKQSIALLSAFFLTISPWFFIFSRTGYEASVGLMFFLLGIYLFLWLNKTVWFLPFSVLSFILSLYSYNSFRIITPLVIISLFVIYYDTLVYHSNKIRYFLVILITALIIIVGIIPVARLILFDQGAVRFQTVGIQSKRGIETAKQFGINYFSHFSPSFLFLTGDSNLRSQQKDFGQVYWLDLPLFILGLLFILKQRKFLYFFPLLMILLGPIPAAITRESPHSLRSISMAPFFCMVSALGFYWVGEKLKMKFMLYTGIIVFSLIFFINYFYNFLTIYPIQSAQAWQYPYKKLSVEYQDEFSNFDHVIISDQYGQPYIFLLYFLRYDPQKFQAEVKLNSPDKWGFSKVAGFGNFIFEKIDLDKLPSGKLLIFATPSEKLKETPEKSLLKNLDDSIAFYVYHYQK